MYFYIKVKSMAHSHKIDIPLRAGAVKYFYQSFRHYDPEGSIDAPFIINLGRGYDITGNVLGLIEMVNSTSYNRLKVIMRSYNPNSKRLVYELRTLEDLTVATDQFDMRNKHHDQPEALFDLVRKIICY